MPGMPSTPTAVEIGAIFGSILARPLPSEIACVCQPARDSTMSPLAKAGIVRRDHLADRAALHHAADRHRLGVGRPVAHAPAHVGIEREPDGAQEDFARAGRRHRTFLEAEIGWLGFADGARGEDDAFALGHGWFPPDCCSSYVVRHCERSEAIHAPQAAKWIAFAALAMTERMATSPNAVIPGARSEPGMLGIPGSMLRIAPE